VLQCVAVCCSASQKPNQLDKSRVPSVVCLAVGCSVLQCIAVCCNVLQKPDQLDKYRVTICCVCCSVLQYVVV